MTETIDQPSFRRWLKDVYRRPRQRASRPAKVFAGLPYLVALPAAAGILVSGYDGPAASILFWLIIFGTPAAATTVLACRPQSWTAGALAGLAGLVAGVLLAFGILFGAAVGITVIDVQPSGPPALFTGALLGGAVIGAAPAIAAGHVAAWLMDRATAPDRLPAGSHEWERYGENGEDGDLA